MTPRIHRGWAGSAGFVQAFLDKLSPDRVLLVCRPDSFSRSGAREWLLNTLGVLPPVFSEFSSNPKIEEVGRGIELFRAIGAEAIIAVGGGSVLDMAKLIDFLGSRECTLEEYLANPSARSAPLRPLLAVPTTAGSGSEATRFAVVYQGRTKHSISDLAVRPGHVLLVPEFTASATPFQTACSGMDALAQGVEAQWAREATEECRNDAREAVRLALAHLPAAVHHPDLSHRAAMLEAAHLAGRAIDISKTTGAHAFSYILTTVHGLPHGQAVGLLLPFFVRLHRQAGIHIDRIQEADIRNLLAEIGLARTLPATADELFDLLTRHVNLERLSNNPVAVDEVFIREMADGLAGNPGGVAEPSHATR